MKIYLPSWNGDMRLESDGDEGAKLTLIDPTPQERVVVGAFLRIAEKKHWWDGKAPVAGEPYQGKELEIKLNAFLAKASNALISVARPKDRTLTAVKFSVNKAGAQVGNGQHIADFPAPSFAGGFCGSNKEGDVVRFQMTALGQLYVKEHGDSLDIWATFVYTRG